jgi:hypothetical protein
MDRFQYRKCVRLQTGKELGCLFVGRGGKSEKPPLQPEISASYRLRDGPTSLSRSARRRHGDGCDLNSPPSKMTNVASNATGSSVNERTQETVVICIMMRRSGTSSHHPRARAVENPDGTEQSPIREGKRSCGEE